MNNVNQFSSTGNFNKWHDWLISFAYSNVLLEHIKSKKARMRKTGVSIVSKAAGKLYRLLKESSFIFGLPPWQPRVDYFPELLYFWPIDQNLLNFPSNQQSQIEDSSWIIDYTEHTACTVPADSIVSLLLFHLKCYIFRIYRSTQSLCSNARQLIPHSSFSSSCSFIYFRWTACASWHFTSCRFDWRHRWAVKQLTYTY